MKVLVVTARLDVQSIRTALGYGAAGYLPKDEDSDELLLAIRRVAMGRRYISADIARLFTPEPVVAFTKLTASEATILQLVGEGFTSKEISQRLDISEATARKHRENIRRKWARATAPKWRHTPSEPKHRTALTCADSGGARTSKCVCKVWVSTHSSEWRSGVQISKLSCPFKRCRSTHETHPKFQDHTGLHCDAGRTDRQCERRRRCHVRCLSQLRW